VNGVAGNVFSEASQLLIDYLYAYYEGRRGAFFTRTTWCCRRLFEAVGGSTSAS